MTTIEEVFALACQRLRTGDFANAERLYLDILRTDPTHAGAHCCLGSVRQGQGRAKEAIACYQQAIEKLPDFAEAGMCRGKWSSAAC